MDVSLAAEAIINSTSTCYNTCCSLQFDKSFTNHVLVERLIKLQSHLSKKHSAGRASKWQKYIFHQQHQNGFKL